MMKPGIILVACILLQGITIVWRVSSFSHGAAWGWLAVVSVGLLVQILVMSTAAYVGLFWRLKHVEELVHTLADTSGSSRPETRDAPKEST